MTQNVYYTCITGNRDPLRAVPECARSPNWRFVAFTDESTARVDWGGWEVRPLVEKLDDPARTSRWHKHHPFELFPDTALTLYADATHQPKRDLGWAEACLGRGADLATFNHPTRGTVAAEAQAVLDQQLDDRELVKAQVARYRASGFPDNVGLCNGAVLLRRNGPEMRKFQTAWWEEIAGGSRRDQISLPYVLWKFPGISRTALPGNVRGENPYFTADYAGHGPATYTVEGAPPSVIVVLGGHRCGTSCVAGILHHLGVPMGDRLLPPNATNPAGFYEDEEFLELHRRMLGELEPDGKINAKAWHYPVPRVSPHVNAYKSLIERRKMRAAWGVKDPRLCYLLPFFLEALGPEPVRFVCVHRPWRHAARSLQARDGLTSQDAESIAWGYHKQLVVVTEKAIQHGPVLSLDYDRVVNHPFHAVSDLARFSKHEHGDFDAAIVSIDPALRHIGTVA